MAARSKARKRALEVLYEAEIRGEPPADVLDRSAGRRGPAARRAGVRRPARRRACGEHRERIDELIATYAVGWTLDRMPIVDRNILRLGAYELLWSDEVPDGVAISEAVALATELSTDESPRFVNGLLSRLLRAEALAVAVGVQGLSQASAAPICAALLATDGALRQALSWALVKLRGSRGA